MRTIALFGVITILSSLPASAQSQPSHPYGLDPYKPSDAAVLRNYGPVLVAETPLLELGGLDPYNPTEAALLRQIGNGVPQCCILVGGTPGFGPLTAQVPAVHSQAAPQVVVLMPPAAAVASGSPSPAASPAAAAGPVTTAIRPEFNDGVTIRYGGRVYVSAGRAIRLQGSELEQVGESAGAPVYQRSGTSDTTFVYVRAREGMVAPYRLKP